MLHGTANFRVSSRVEPRLTSFLRAPTPCLDLKLPGPVGTCHFDLYSHEAATPSLCRIAGPPVPPFALSFLTGELVPARSSEPSFVSPQSTSTRTVATTLSRILDPPRTAEHQHIQIARRYGHPRG